MITIKNKFLITFLLSLALMSTANANGAWTKIDVPSGPHDISVNGQIIEISPSCALSTYTGEPYSFYVKPGKTDKLLIYLNGGGACWNGATCDPTSSPPAYVPTTTARNDPNTMDGLFDVTNAGNPYKGWTMIFLPYCTGDVFLGSKESVYDTSISPTTVIHHRGKDNFLYVMNWLREYQGDEPALKTVVAGSSAGSYGASINYPWVKDMLLMTDKSRTFLISDGGAGVLTNPFLEDALFGSTSSWAIDENLHPSLSELTNVEEGLNLIPEAYRIHSQNYPKDKLAQYTTAFDIIQMYFVNLMQGSEGFFNALWPGQMQTIMMGLSDELPNYRRYVEAGCNHTIFRYPEFYSSNIEDTSFLNWLTGMTGGKHRNKEDWQNLSCTPGFDCGGGSLTEEVVGACIARSFGP